MEKTNYELFEMATEHIAYELFTNIYHYQNVEDYIYYFMYVYDDSVGQNRIIAIGIENKNNPEDRNIVYPFSVVGKFLYDLIDSLMIPFNVNHEEIKDIFWTSKNLQNSFESKLVIN